MVQLPKLEFSGTSDTSETFRIFSNEMPVLLLTLCFDDILVVYLCIQTNFLIFASMSKCFFKSLWQRETQVRFFLRNNSL